MKAGAARNTYCLISLLVTFFAIGTAYYYVSEKREVLIEKKYLNLLKVVTSFERFINNGTLFLTFSEADKLPISSDKKAKIINESVQPFLEQYITQYPGYEFGIYADDIERTIAVGPTLNLEKLVVLKNAAISQAFDSSSLQFAEITMTEGWEGNPIAIVTYPILHQGKVIGHIWVSANKADIENDVNRVLVTIIVYFASLWLLMMAALYYLFLNFDTTLQVLIKQIRTGDNTPKSLALFPELIPVLETITDLKEKLRLEYVEREKISDEIAKISRMTLVTEMAASVAHEVRNPLTVVVGYTQLLMKRVDAGLQPQFTTILAELGHINKVVTDFLSLAKNTGNEKRVADLNQVLSDLYPLLYAECVRYNSEIHMVLADKLPTVKISDKELTQIILNLARNSIEAMKGQAGKLTIASRFVDERVQLSIADTGCGIPPEIIEQIFNPLYTTKENGTGLGLAVCKRIADRYNAAITVASANGAGTIFTVIFAVPKVNSQLPLI